MWIICINISVKTYFEYFISFWGVDIESYFYVFFSLGMISFDFYLLIVVVVFGVCEATLGLAFYSSFIRLHGNDYVLSLSVYKL
uniref:NADH dehydrogenase subunit 4L n=1 Tax=Amphioctopus fangsiao TaxID=515817 RepID=A0A344AYP8_AMPFA|nr:NADH dehydrogenase subunit 4L [Amphioctopus fangsiao]